jgi:nickel/cobalt transporter (NiCoT) family protein
VSASPVVAGRLRRVPLSRAEWVRIGGMAVFIAALHVIGWFTLIALIAPHHYHLGKAGAFTIGAWGDRLRPGDAARVRC